MKGIARNIELHTRLVGKACLLYTSNGINPASGKNKKFYTIENGTMVSADQQMIRGKQYALELTGATNKDGNALTAGSQIVVKHVAGVFLKCQ